MDLRVQIDAKSGQLKGERVKFLVHLVMRKRVQTEQQ